MQPAELIARLKSQLIVSCQATAGEPFDAPAILAALAQSVVRGGAAGIRAERPDNILAIRQAVDVPVIGLYKRRYADSPLHITPTLADALAVADAGADIIALDATDRPRPNGETLAQVVRELRARTGCLLMADIATEPEGLAAAALGFDFVGTTMSGYTGAATPDAPDLALVAALARRPMRVIAEGRIATPAQAAEALRCGAFAVVVGTAITRPAVITRGFVEALPRSA
jgi:N-acylglucosamine-6-phosphate 2-epimerase